MNTKKLLFASLLLASVAFSAGATEQGTAFTYQGQLQLNGQPANGTFPATFALFDASSGGNQVGTTIFTSVTATNGVFSTQLNYPGAFNGTQLWVEITVNGQLLAGRQLISTTPVAQFALNGGVALDYTANASTAASPPSTTLATIGAITFKASCGLSATNAVTLSLKVSSTSSFDLSEIIFSQFNGAGALTTGPAQGTNLTSANIDTAVSASGSVQRVWVSPSILRSYAAPPVTDAIQVYMVADATPAIRTCRVEGQVTPGF